MPYTQSAGARIFYRVDGLATGRLPLLLSHGYSASSDMWAGNLPALAAGRQVISWDIRGHGRSDSPAESVHYSREASVADMAAVLDACGIQRAAIGGLSLGGYLSLAFQAAHSDRVAALLLFDTGPGYRNLRSRERWNELAEAQADRWDERGRPGLAMAGRGIMAQHDSDVIDSLRHITVPTLVVVGADDTPFRGAADYLAATIPTARLHVIDGAGHAVNTDRPAEFDRAVLDFLDQLPAE